MRVAASGWRLFSSRQWSSNVERPVNRALGVSCRVIALSFELFNDSARDELAVAVALRQLVPSSNELTAGESAALAPKRQ
jgi:hypothetical protein